MRKIIGIIPILAVVLFVLNPLDIFADEPTATIPVLTMPGTTPAATAVATPAVTVVTPEQQALLDQLALQQAAAAAQQQALLDALAAQQAALLAQQQAMIEATLAAQAQAAQTAAANQAALAAQDASMRAASTGMTYIDISIDNQILTYFVNGQVALTTPCVTGGPKNGTPRGVFMIDSKVPGKYLTGPTWHVWVNRWMRFAGNCGIHDASWRRNFGGDIYMHNGSHGCVNIPPDQATQLYNMVGIGTVVVVH